MPEPTPTPSVHPGLLADVPGRHAASRPQAPALSFGGQTHTYRQLSASCGQAAQWLWLAGVRPGDRVAWLGFNHPGQLALLFALARLGAMLVPLNFRLAPAEWQAVLADCSPSLLLHDSAWAEAATGLAAATGVAAHPVEVLERESAQAVPDGLAQPSSPALLVYTSGTTGQPKGAVHTQANLLANMRIAAQVQQLTAEDRVLTVLPLFHVGGLCIQTLPALLAGAHVLLHPRFEAQAALDALEHERPSLTLQVPATMKALAAHPRWPGADLASLRAVWAGSSLLPPAVVEAFVSRGLPVCNVYGATETGPFSIALPPQQAASHAGSCGWPAPGVEARLLAPRQGVGEVLLRAPNVVQRYWPDRPALDGEGWFHTGDLACCADDGSYTIVGRAREMIISGGENIYPAEIENLLATHPAVADCAVIGLADTQWGEAVVAALVLREGAWVSDGELLAHLDGRIARYKLPRRFVRLPSLPRTALGKVQKAALAQALSPAALEAGRSAP